MGQRTMVKAAEQDYLERRPVRVNGADVLEVHGYTPRGLGSYAYAVAVSRWVYAGGRRQFTTHYLVDAHDRADDDPHRWYLDSGTYHDTLAEAVAEAKRRAAVA